ncbi:uncharacterized protein H6S33_011726 [Morchella sextelata]|uniref:uncharacterized protein n=1 Tax=Morchella sextelata TaxID=1174677 RepID=UPI001D04A858|nr:uncharacterized protein H6S33_011726 [Morchella sextelata]KAH0610199.1 hypothetical protein H6S33_011726 [Morchella sextelata]
MSPPEDTTSNTTRAQSLAVAPGTDDPTHSYLTYRSPLLNPSLPDNQMPEDPHSTHPPLAFTPDAVASRLLFQAKETLRKLASSEEFSSLDLPKGRKRNLSETSTHVAERTGHSVISQQASLQSFFTQSTPQGTAPPQNRNTQNPNPTPPEAQEQEFSSTFATESDYNDPYQPRIDYLYPSTVPHTTHTQTDLNYITWAIRHATSQICPPSDRIEILEEQSITLRRTVETLKHQIEAQTMMITNMHSAIHSLLNKPQPQQQQQQQQQPQHPQPQPQQRQRTAPPAAPQTTLQAAPQAAPQVPPPIPPQPRGWKAGTWAAVASAAGPAQEKFQVVERRKKPAKPKADPLFKPEYTKINREIIVETTAPSDVNPSEIRTLVNARIQDESCHFISARRTAKDNFILETKFVTPATKAMEYAKEIEEALLPLQSKFLLHGIPTTIGEGIEAGQLVASEIRSNYGENFQLAQVPRWISRAETRMGKTHSSMVVALPGQITMETLGVKFLSLFNRSCHIEAFLPTFPDTQCAKCLEYGHCQEKCKNNGKCGHCAGDHLTSFHPCNECQGGYKCTHTPIRCLNCKGIYKASDPACPFAQIAKTIQTLDNCLVMGDFNCHHQMWYGVTSHEYRNNIRADRANGVYTHFPGDRGKRPTIIDLTFVKGPILDHNLRWSTEPYGAGSDHGRTSIHLHLEKPPFVPRRIWRQTDWKLLENHISNLSLPAEAWETKEHMEQTVEFSLELVKSTINIVTPLSKEGVRANSWWSDEMKQMKARVNSAERKARNTRKPNHVEGHRKACREWTVMIRKAKADQREKTMNEAKGSEVWRILNVGRRRDTIIPTIQGEESFAGKCQALRAQLFPTKWTSPDHPPLNIRPPSFDLRNTFDIVTPEELKKAIDYSRYTR